jgi:thioesterase domain-containing protein/acyl carrier protein
VTADELKFVAPRGTLEERLAGIWSEVLGIPLVGIHDDFFALGGHSLLAVSLFARIEKTFSQRLPLATVFQAPTVGQLADVLRRKGEGAPWSPLVAIQPHGSRPPFFCVHGWGDQVLIFHALAQHLGPEQPFYGLQAPDQDAEGIISSKIKEMAASYVGELRGVQPEGPYFLGGYSVGGVVALEMAQQLLTQGQDVALLAMFDTTHPNYLKASNRSQRTKQALSSYEAQPYPGRITLFRVAKPKFDRVYPDEPYLGWDSVATGGVEMHKVRGRHRSMLREPYVRELAEQLKTCLEQARTNSS